jgi:nicotinate-nucleotide adenylyltransferase
MPLTNHIAIYGGSFNPPHIGHQTACLWLISALNAKAVMVAPTYEHYFGKELADFEHRMEMCQLMCSYVNFIYPNDEYENEREIFVTDIEKELPKPNTTLNLVNGVKKIDYCKDSQIAVVIGSDLVPELHKWHEWEKVAAENKIVAVGRSGFSNAESPLDIYQYPVELSAVSSSDIRERIAKGEPITGLVPHEIERYIYGQNLYA